jgi:hypothetical protein
MPVCGAEFAALLLVSLEADVAANLSCGAILGWLVTLIIDSKCSAAAAAARAMIAGW